MTNVRLPEVPIAAPDMNLARPDRVGDEPQASKVARFIAAGLRISLGWVFLWAFLDKALGLGHETAKADAWIKGGSPTQGFLAFGAAGPFKGFYNDIAGAGWANWLFMLGLLAVGVALILGVTMRIAAVAGSAMLLMMWTAVLPPANNLFMDDHLIYAGLLGLLALTNAGCTVGLGLWWADRAPARTNTWLR
jgi:thiosulfate dehydrogenase [quinone] large subunit